MFVMRGAMWAGIGDLFATAVEPGSLIMDGRLAILPMEPAICGIPATTRAFEGRHNHRSPSILGEESNDTKIVVPASKHRHPWEGNA
jgi:hypothetical protein